MGAVTSKAATAGRYPTEGILAVSKALASANHHNPIDAALRWWSHYLDSGRVAFVADARVCLGEQARIRQLQTTRFLVALQKLLVARLIGNGESVILGRLVEMNQALAELYLHAAYFDEEIVIPTAPVNFGMFVGPDRVVLLSASKLLFWWKAPASMNAWRFVPRTTIELFDDCI